MDATSPLLERISALHPKRIDLSLGRLERLLERLGNPEARLPPVIHIAGTNGKGSVSAMLRAMLEADGKRVHVYTSPHLVSFNERIRLGAEGGGRLVGDDVLTDALERAEAANGGEPITFFEITTAAAFLLFAEMPADALVLETGLGGRLDATNMVERPIASVLTTIGIDHVGFLGPTLGEITMEKAGIIKPGVPVICAPQKDEVTAVVERQAGIVRAPLHLGGMDWTVAQENGRLVYQDENGLVDLPLPRLPGRHQTVNAGVAIATARTTGIIDRPASLEAGMTTVDWPGRMHRLTRGRIVDWAPADADIWLDGGHNADAGEVVAAALADLEDRVSRPLFLIAGMLTTKDPAGYFQHFAGLARHVFTVGVPTSDASIAPAALAEAAVAAGLSAEPVTSVRTALRLLAENWRYEPPPRIVICGSLYLVGDVLAQNGTPPT
ncbi:folylpolyglutamate synthase/dihydrofolate synthase family protein [Acuticoccus sp. I52.16.1]|uniref:bifunctional folylpolyglutamate synthase/dihydrofolate synthase n=1 Tax=Acuticoccus sp. I52.16.1 TaxID=2928472 RepID=UPI001FD2D3C5|nr:folylpolyglutamate synthase/dihydrofolate synthase family protein [Acuticoccus sp. I52.16.1]UOM33403.1 bifunctional folylpolyglutamate synthase/dihydrofolate synthase [Acuticoccus sp. I52.16.1]